jgi:hypothetical protein
MRVLNEAKARLNQRQYLTHKGRVRDYLNDKQTALSSVADMSVIAQNT